MTEDSPPLGEVPGRLDPKATDPSTPTTGEYEDVPKTKSSRQKKTSAADGPLPTKKTVEQFQTKDYSNPDFWGFIAREMLDKLPYKLPTKTAEDQRRDKRIRDKLPELLERYESLSKTRTEYRNPSFVDDQLGLDRIKAFVLGVWLYDQELDEDERYISDKDIRRVMHAINSVSAILTNVKAASNTLKEAEARRKTRLRIRNSSLKEAARDAIENELDAVDLAADMSQNELVDLLGEMCRQYSYKLKRREAHSDLLRASVGSLRSANKSLIQTVHRLKTDKEGKAAADRWESTYLKSRVAAEDRAKSKAEAATAAKSTKKKEK